MIGLPSDPSRSVTINVGILDERNAEVIGAFLRGVIAVKSLGIPPNCVGARPRRQAEGDIDEADLDMLMWLQVKVGKEDICLG